MDKTKWIDRKFQFDFPEGWIFNVLERLYGTEFRIKAITTNLNESDCSHRLNNKWSIKEHIGHLIDLEELFIARLHEIKARKEVLTPADIQNKKTESTNYNTFPVTDLIEHFARKRLELTNILSHLEDSTQQFGAFHERLGLKMRPVDVGFFAAEHDDHHLAIMRTLL